MLHVGKRGLAVGHEALHIDVPADEDKCDQPRPPLQQVHPVAYPGILRHIRLPFPPHVHAVAPVEQNRQPDGCSLNENSPWDCLQLARSLVVLGHAHQRVAVGPKVLGQEGPDGENAGEGMQFAPEEAVVRPNPCRRYGCSVDCHVMLDDLASPVAVCDGIGSGPSAVMASVGPSESIVRGLHARTLQYRYFAFCFQGDASQRSQRNRRNVLQRIGYNDGRWGS